MNTILRALQAWNRTPEGDETLESYLQAGLRALLESTGGRRALFVAPAMEEGEAPLEVGLTAEGAPLAASDLPEWEALLAGEREIPAGVLLLSMQEPPEGRLYLESAQPLGEAERTLAEAFVTLAGLLYEKRRWQAAYRRARREKASYVSVVSHELRLPMTSIKGYTDLMLKGMAGAVNEMQTNFLGVIRNNVERMSRLIANLSDLSKAEEGRLKLQITSVAPAEVAQKAAAALEETITGREQHFIREVPGDLPNVRADASRLEEILTILLRNAALYTPSGGTIRLTAQSEGEGVAFLVEDTGMGIADDDAPRVFEQFFRSEDQRVRDHPGWGLGLSVARMLARRQGGSLTFETVPEEGSVFRLWIPAAGNTADGA
ncbi:MAG TPA: HAMP domain-containing histidine kinase [Chloroflexi bacterium]|nr:HAMP domain-containing histidine kinase [Chloroflexota bacterium]